MPFNNPYNYVRVSELQPVSIEALGIVITLVYFLYLVLRREASLEIAYFLALPFSDDPFRLASSVQPVEAISMLLVVLNYKSIRLNYVILIGLLFVLFSVIGYITGNVQSSFSLLYSLKFLLIGLVFSVFIKRPFTLPISVMRFAVAFAFCLTCLQVGLWIIGLPIHGIFYAGIFPRPKGLAHEPATWSIFLFSLFPFICHFKLGRRYLWMNSLTLLMTLSTFGFVAALSFVLLREVLLLSRRTLRWSPRPLRLKKKRLIAAGLALVLVLALPVAVPGLLGSAAKLLSVFNKLIEYQQELTEGLGGSTQFTPQNDTSGRGLDFTYFRAAFPEHWLVGIGSFNAPYTDQSQISGTNAYLITPVELGIVGTFLFFVLLFLHYRTLFRDSRHKSADFLAASLNMLLMIAGIRCLGFSEVWYVHSAALRTASLAAAPPEELSDTTLPEEEMPASLSALLPN